MIKFIVQIILKFFGYRLLRYDKGKIKFDDILLKIFKNKSLKIVDIGANEGQSVKRFNKIFKKTIIYSIEPSKFAYEFLIANNKNSKNVHFFNYAIGDVTKKKLFYDYNLSVLSSFHKINKKESSNLKYKKEEVQVITLDQFCESKKLSNVSILKIDTQGSEEKILKGGSISLKNGVFDIIELEIIMGNYYEKYFSFLSIEKFLIKFNYRLLALDRTLNFFKDPRMYCNAIYVRNDLYDKIK
jgi:FkbM family methyltransferase